MISVRNMIPFSTRFLTAPSCGRSNVPDAPWVPLLKTLNSCKRFSTSSSTNCSRLSASMPRRAKKYLILERRVGFPSGVRSQSGSSATTSASGAFNWIIWGLSRNGVKNYSKGPCVTILE